MMYVPYLRRPYGPRRRRRYVDDELGIAAADLPPGQVEQIVYPLPNGGRRIVAECPSCRRRSARFYLLWARYVCRQCAGLHYRSQYEGRRVEATIERRWALRTSAENAKKAATRERRLARAEAAFEVWAQRQNDYEDRADRALMAFMPRARW